MQNDLNKRQLRFIDEYLTDMNATQAVIRAGYSEKGASNTGCRLLADPRIRREVDERVLERSGRVQITAELVLREYYDVWKAEITDILTDDWQLKPLSEWPRVWKRMATPNEVKELKDRSEKLKDAEPGKRRDGWRKIGESVKFSIFPKAEALRKLGEHVSVGAFPKRESSLNVEINANDLIARLERGRQRAALDRERVIDLEANEVDTPENWPPALPDRTL